MMMDGVVFGAVFATELLLMLSASQADENRSFETRAHGARSLKIAKQWEALLWELPQGKMAHNLL